MSDPKRYPRPNVRVLHPCPTCRQPTTPNDGALVCANCRDTFALILRACDQCGSLFDPVALHRTETGFVCLACLPGAAS